MSDSDEEDSFVNSDCFTTIKDCAPITKFVGGQIAYKVNEWKKLSGDPWLINSIQGVRIPFEEVPRQTREPRPFKLSVEESDFVSVELGRLQDLGIIERTEPSPHQVVSNIFLRPKKDGKFRLILDLTWLNTHVKYEHFKMHSLQTARDLMRKDCWLGSVDLKDAYYSVPVFQGHRKFLRFRWAGQLFQFKVLPNGLACAPRFFTKILIPPFAKLREKGVESFPYIDDSFVVADSFDKCKLGLKQLEQLLTKLGFVVHPTKSVLEPTQRLTFLGFELDSREFKIFLTRDKEEKLIRAAQQLLEKPSPTIREVAGLVGLMVAFSQAFIYGEAHFKSLEKDKIEALARSRGDFDHTMLVSSEGRKDILWWLGNIQNSGNPIQESSPDLTVFTDASMEGWGAHVGPTRTGGRWSDSEKLDHINVLELRAILFGLRSLCDVSSTHIRIMTDNTTALAYVKHKGGTRSPECNLVAKLIWSWAEQRTNWLSIAHIPGVENVVADHDSRNFADNLEWSLNQKLFDKLASRFGLPEIDLFASRLNNKVNKYISWKPDPNACAIDAFSCDWGELNFYAFPPFSCLSKVIAKIVEDGATGTLLVPWWPTQPWWGRLMALQLQYIRFRRKKNNLIPLGQPEQAQFLNNTPLGAFHFLGNSS